MRKLVLEVTLSDNTKLHVDDIAVWPDVITTNNEGTVLFRNKDDRWAHSLIISQWVDIKPVLIDIDDDTDPRAADIKENGYHGL